MKLNNFIEIKNTVRNTAKTLSRKYGGCTLMDNKLIVACDNNNLQELQKLGTLRNELFNEWNNSVFIVEKDKTGKKINKKLLADAHNILNQYVINYTDTIGYYVNNTGLLMKEKGILLQCSKLPNTVLKRIKQLLNQETLGIIKSDGLHFY